MNTQPLLLLVDDEPTNLQVLRHTLHDDYRLLFAKNGQTALDLARINRPDLILLDIMMPGLSGYEVCTALKQDEATSAIPVIFVTALADATNEERGLGVGAVDYIAKPFNPSIVKARVRTHLSLVHVKELEETRLQIVQRLGIAGEYKDNETGQHVMRVSHSARLLAKAAGYDDATADDVLQAAAMHDIGKIGIPDSILLKPGKLSPEEWVTMRQHTSIGAHILGDHPSGMLRMGATIALYHHEKWDGSGYPKGLSGNDIPHVARIVAIVDVYDALTNARPYKPAWPVEKALNLIQSESGKHFDPELVSLFMLHISEIQQIRDKWPDKTE